MRIKRSVQDFGGFGTRQAHGQRTNRDIIIPTQRVQDRGEPSRGRGWLIYTPSSKQIESLRLDNPKTLAQQILPTNAPSHKDFPLAAREFCFPHSGLKLDFGLSPQWSRCSTSATSDGAELGVRGDAGGGLQSLGGSEPRHHHQAIVQTSAAPASQVQWQGRQEEGAGAVAGRPPDACVWCRWRSGQVASRVGSIQASQFVWYVALELALVSHSVNAFAVELW